MTEVAAPRPASTENDVELVLAFLNTVDEELGTDVLTDAAGWHEWARNRGTEAADPIDTATATREALRAAVLREEPPSFAGPAVRVELRDGLPVLVGETTVGAVLAAAVRLGTTGEWARIKICPAENCRWAFHDSSRNRSRTWCSMRVCGNREKARNWRRRQR